MYRLNWLLTLLLLGLPGVLSSQDNSTSVATPDQAIIRYDYIHHPVNARNGMVVTQNYIASQVGQQVLKDGGNAVDAAVAIGFALAATLPRAGNLGGSGYMLIHSAASGETHALDFRSVAPAAASLEEFLDNDGDIVWDDLTYGARAAAVPGTVAGLYQAWQRFGSRPWAELVQPAIDLASDGFEVSFDLAYSLREAMPAMSAFPSSVAVYAKPDGSAYEFGDTLRQPDLAWSLTQIRDGGAEAFYRGPVAEKFVSFMNRTSGFISAADLAGYQVQEQEAISVSYRDHRVVTMPPSSVGGLALLQMLNVLNQFDLAALPQGSAQSLHLIAETMKRVNANRRLSIGGIGDTAFVDVPVEGFLSETLAREMAASIDPDKATPASELAPIDAIPYESRDTTHYSVVDAAGNAVSTTYTLGYSFGSAIVVEGTGILLDNQMRNFSLRDEGHANSLAPGKRMVSTMTPTLVFDENNELLLVTGTPGGSLIHTIILQLIVNVVDYQLNIAEATHRPRIYQDWRQPELGVERGINSDTINLLQGMGHTIEVQQSMGSTQSIMLEDGLFFASADPRRPGALALGVDQVVPGQ